MHVSVIQQFKKKFQGLSLPKKKKKYKSALFYTSVEFVLKL